MANAGGWILLLVALGVAGGVAYIVMSDDPSAPATPSGEDARRAPFEPGNGAEPEVETGSASGHPIRLELETNCPGYVVVNEPFEVLLRVHNVSRHALPKVVFGVQAHGKLEPAPGSKEPERWIDRMPGDYWRTLKANYVATEEGIFRLIASARDETGWAAAGLWIDVKAGTSPSTNTIANYDRLSLKVELTGPEVVTAGAPFRMTATVTNVGTQPLRGVELALSGEGVEVVEGEKPRTRIDELGARHTQTLAAMFVSTARGKQRVNASARDEKGWAAAGAVLDVNVEDE